MKSNESNSQDFLAQAVDLATANVLRKGGPFGAIVVTADGQVFEGINRVTANNDPTAHAEVTAIRNACASLGTFDLSGATLYTSCEPCPMCLASSLWARVEKIYFAADRHDAARAGFDDAAFYEYFDTPVELRPLPVRQLEPGAVDALAPFNAWNALETRIDY
ncbi:MULTISPECIES: nucleoside deaminase [Arthrobacter]|uniref:tRNA-specific adenosine deaminase n=1 Tax=Arthrobacter psychrochitiniphilus TaxID=291045 RepID=A0A2V3DPI3_9MICC|nr:MULTISPECIES: nucleoside deaminase [Arthrobacter]NYG16216.1 guanine deaminase [Arthrobacter psychrochitiniphilus]PXA64409.1 tRNA-specific adenosine deaminase [Arthrobacter psychrochitiniphilus]